MNIDENTTHRGLPLKDTLKHIDALGRWEGHKVTSIEVSEEEGTVFINLVPQEGWNGGCSLCGCQRIPVHEHAERLVRDLPVFDFSAVLRVRTRRLLCPHCGPIREDVPWLGRYARVTNRLANSVAFLCDVMPVKAVAQFYRLNWHTVKEIHKRTLRFRLDPVDLANVTVLLMDEFAIQKGHRYATVVVDPTRKEVLWVGRGRSRKDIRPFFQLLGPRCKHIEAVGMDMSAAYGEEVRHHCPQAQIVYDLYHVVARYGLEVVDRVRVDVANSLRQDKKARAFVKGARWLLLRNRENLQREEERIRLNDLLEANKDLATVYVFKDHFKRLWSFNDEIAAKAYWHQLMELIKESGIKPLIHFANKLSVYLPGILAHCRWKLTTALVEGINNTIKVIKRMAYGFRDDEYFFLRIRSAFPGIAR